MLGIKREDSPDGAQKNWIGPAPWIQTVLPGPAADAAIRLERQSGLMAAVGDYPLVIRRASGSVIEDVDGNRFLDFATGCTTGHANPKVAETLSTQADTLIHVCGGTLHTPLIPALAESLIDLTPGAFVKRALLLRSGDEAVLQAVRIACDATKRRGLITFHGSRHVPLLLGALPPSMQPGNDGAGAHVAITQVDYGDAESIETGLREQRLVPEDVAAILVEPMQTVAACADAPPRFLLELRRICDSNGIVLICDETGTGMGRTGKLLAVEHREIVPDIVILGEGLAGGMPIGAAIIRAELLERCRSAADYVSNVNPVCTAAAIAALELVQTQYRQSAVALGDRLAEGLTAIAEHRKVLTNLRGAGLLRAADVVSRRTGKGDASRRNRLLLASFERGLLILPCDHCGLRFRPPLCINETQLDVGLRTLDEAIATVI